MFVDRYDVEIYIFWNSMSCCYNVVYLILIILLTQMSTVMLGSTCTKYNVDRYDIVAYILEECILSCCIPCCFGILQSS